MRYKDKDKDKVDWWSKLCDWIVRPRVVKIVKIVPSAWCGNRLKYDFWGHFVLAALPVRLVIQCWNWVWRRNLEKFPKDVSNLTNIDSASVYIITWFVCLTCHHCTSIPDGKFYFWSKKIMHVHDTLSRVFLSRFS
jgi:hypothetical protein